MKVKFLQEGGPMPAPEQGGAPAPAPEQGPGPEQIAQEVLQMLLQQLGDPALVGQVLEVCMAMLSEASQAPQPAFARQGGKFIRIR
jgi:hypothetical protein